jgi:hypothetical protein
MIVNPFNIQTIFIGLRRPVWVVKQGGDLSNTSRWTSML